MELLEADFDRRRFIKTAGLGSLALVSLGPLVAVPAQAHDRDKGLNYRWMSLSANAGDTERVVMNGNGFVNESSVSGSGRWNHTKTEPPVAEILGFGTWKARRLRSLKIIGTYGGFAAGTMVMDVSLFPDEGDEIPARVTMNCNIPPAGLFTDLPEGFMLSFDGQDFSPKILPVKDGGPPPAIAVGATIFNLPLDDRDDDDDDDEDGDDDD